MSDVEHKCHCSHLVVIKHHYDKADWVGIERCVSDVRRITWAIGAIFLLVAGIAIKEAWSLEAAHIRADMPRARDGERMGSDRIPEPSK